MPLFSPQPDLEVAAEWNISPTHKEREILVMPRNGVILTAGSDLDQAAQSSGDRGLPWPRVFNAIFKRMANNWKRNGYVEVHAKVLPGNYGIKGSVPNWHFRGREFNTTTSYPGTVPTANRPMWNNLVPIVWGLRDVDLSAQAQAAELVQIPTLPIAPIDFTPAGAASIQEPLQ